MKLLTLTVCLVLFVVGISRTVLAQNKMGSSPALAAESLNREQDGLKGPVRRVRVESAKIVMKGGNLIEGPRVVRGIATYDPAGKKIDSVDYPVEGGTVAGKEQYRYDDKGNIVEMIVRANDGSILSKEIYEYEFDQLGNWTKMNSSVAVYESGKMSYELTEVTYRNISYYYDQAMETLKDSPSKPAGVTVAQALRSSIPAKQVSVTNQPISGPAAAEAKKDTLTTAASVAPAQTTNLTAESPSPKSSDVNADVNATTSTVSASNAVKHVAEDVLRNAAIDLPKPEYSEAARLAQVTGKVEVQILVDDKGQVTNARATSGNPLLGSAAEAAARKARFSPTKLSSDSSRVYGAISYDFTLPSSAITALPVTSPAIDIKQPKPDVRKPEAQPNSEAAALVEKPKAEPNNSEVATETKSAYRQGVAFLASGRYQEAIQALNQAIKVDPNDVSAYIKLGMSYSGLQKDKEAIAVLKMAVQINRSALDAPAYFLLGQSYLGLSKNSEALAAFKQALFITRAEAIGLEKEIQKIPTPEQLHYGMGLAYLNSKRFGDSINELKQVVKLNPKNADAYYALAIAYIGNDNRMGAENQQKILKLLDADLARKISIALAAPPPNAPRCRNIACR